MEKSSSSSSSIETNNPSTADSKPPVIYRCKKCRRMVASEENMVSHRRGEGQKCFKWNKRNETSRNECSSIFVEPMKWMMQTVDEGCVEAKLECIGCKARLGSFNWAGMQCSCGSWINPAFQLQKSRIDECPF
ncbi:hypothetical protein M569_02227 [Genlisea aurea]|uniref:Uncharacterized protein n=1 Tax=Genlisea aurea TaxID=192259 RepID=S8CZM6_9LAMI|nr:hypothetical protein M569_02227 [Genlisea aurea]